MSRVRVLGPWLDSGEIAHKSGTINGVPRPRRRYPVRKPVAMYMYGVKRTAAAFCNVSKMHRSRGNYPEQMLKLTLFAVCVYVYMYASNFATLNNTCFILLREYMNPMN